MNRLIYVASSWKNDGPLLDTAHRVLHEEGYTTYDFRSMGRWWHESTPSDPITGRMYTAGGARAFEADEAALEACVGGLAIQPAGEDTARECGYLAGAQKPCVTVGLPRGSYGLMAKLNVKHGAFINAPATEETIRLAVQTLGVLLDGTPPCVVRDPNIMSGQPIIRGTCIPIRSLLARLQDGDTFESLLEDYAYVLRADLEAGVDYARKIAERQ